jgi:hypothetical protein
MIRMTVRPIWASFWKKLGRCRVCLRKAWLATTVTCVAAAFVFFTDWRAALLPTLLLMLSFTLLWAAHLFAYVWKFSSSSRRRAIKLATSPRSAAAASVVLGACGREGCEECERPAWLDGDFLGCEGCHSCGNGCDDDLGTAFPNGC